MRDMSKELAKRWAEENAEFEKEKRINPLIQYSTSQLKAELRRRKSGNK